MPRQARITIPNIAHHITQRGNYQQSVFDSEENNRQYCKLMNEYTQQYGLEVIAYCLMSNHAHFITDKFIKDLENKLKRSLKCLKQGRPKKA